MNANANTKVKKILATSMAATFMVGALAGCASGQPTTTSSTDSDAKVSSTTSSATSEAAATGTLTYPIAGNPTVTYWIDLNSNVSATFPTMNETPLTKKLGENTGVNIEYIHPPQGQAKEAFNLLIASGELPDIIEYAWLTGYNGGPELAFKNKILEPINENLDKWAPDYAAYLKANPDVDKMVRTDEGNYFGFPFIRGDENLMVFYGPYLREDWLKELKLEIPTTIEEWYNVLKAFKGKGVEAPLTTLDKDLGLFSFGNYVSAYGVTTGFHVDAGKVIYGPSQAGFKDFLAEMSKWYKEGLLDPNFYTNDRAAAEKLLMNDKAGATIGYAGSGLGVFQKSLQELKPDAGFVGAPYAALKKGDRPMIGQKDFAFMNNYQVAGVTANSKNKEAAYALLNYGYGKEGDLLYNFGVEGESYTMVNDYPTYTDSVLNPGDGKTMAQMLGQYARSNYNGPFVQRLEYYEQYMQMDLQKEAVSMWKETDADKYQIPPVTPTQDESKEYNTIKTNMDTWVNEWAIGAITGKNSIDDFESKFIAELKNIGVDRAIEIQQGALERYNKR